MKIKLTVDKAMENPNYDANKHERYGFNDPERIFVTRMLEVELTEEQWNAVRKAVLEVM